MVSHIALGTEQLPPRDIVEGCLEVWEQASMGPLGPAGDCFLTPNVGPAADWHLIVVPRLRWILRKQAGLPPAHGAAQLSARADAGRLQG